MPANISSQAPSARYLSAAPRAAFRAFALSAAGFMAWAWFVRDHHYIEAESGVGYALGIIGASLMVLLLMYPLRKRLRLLHGWLKLGSWFRLHMLLGVLGPLCILLHCNFQLGSTNSNVALVCMLLVAGSGLVGRYLYGKFHFGLYGQQVGLHQLREDLDHFHRALEDATAAPAHRQAARALHEACAGIIDSQRTGVSMRQLLRQRRWLRQASQQLRSAGADPVGEEAGRALRDHQRALAALLDKLAGLRLFERLFGLWHVVHIPVFLLMVVTAIVHIVVVHWY